MTPENKKYFMNILTDTVAVPNTLLDHYRELGLTEEETLFLIVLLRLNRKKNQMTFKSVARDSVYSESEVTSLVPVLIDKGFLSFNDGGAILFDGLVEKLLEVQSWQAVKQEQKIYKEKKALKEDKTFAALYQCFEQEMGRPLSPIEGEQITYLYKNLQLPAELIKEGLTRAVLLGKYNFRYVDAILSSWQKQGIHSLAELKHKEEENRSYEEKQNRNKEKPVYPHREFRRGQNKEDIFSDDIYEVF